MNDRQAWKMEVYQVIEGSDDWPLIDTVYGATKKECEEKAEEKYGANADDKHWTGASPNN